MIISRTPFRISLAGGGSDIADYYAERPGAVVALSVSLYMYVTVNRRFDDTLRVSYTTLEIVDRLDDLRHDLIRECLRMVGIDRGIEITTIADVPGGTGLGSSSSLTVGLLNALYAYRGMPIAPDELARRACEIEIDVLGRPIGRQDQFMATLGGVRELTFHRGDDVRSRAIDLSPGEQQQLLSGLMLFYTGIERDGNVILADVKRGIANGQATRRRLDTMVDVAHNLAASLTRRDFSTVGDALSRGWAAKRQMGSSVTSPWIDSVHEAAMAAGASGGKILGAGGGGFLLLACAPDRRPAIVQAMAALGLRNIDFQIESRGSAVVFDGS